MKELINMNPLTVISITASILIMGFILYKLSFFNWIKPSFEGEDGKASFKRLVPYTLTMLSVWMVMRDKIPVEDRWITFLALLATTALYAGVVTWAQLLMARGIREDKKDDIPEEGKKVSVEGEVTIKESNSE